MNWYCSIFFSLRYSNNKLSFCNRKYSDKLRMSGAGSISKEDNVENFPSNGNNCGRHFNNFRKEHHCRICNKVFKEISNFKTHLRTHSGERPYQCKSCPQKFKQMAHLQKHMFSHTGQKPYICRFQNCFKSFSTQYSMKCSV